MQTHTLYNTQVILDQLFLLSIKIFSPDTFLIVVPYYFVDVISAIKTEIYVTMYNLIHPSSEVYFQALGSLY